MNLIEVIRVTVADSAAGTSVDLAKLGINVLAMGAIASPTATADLHQTLAFME